MSSEATPISPTRFAEALKDLSAENLALKVFELRNSIAHLDYSNAELRPYAQGLASVMGSNADTTTTTTTIPTTAQQTANSTQPTSESAATTTTTTDATAAGEVKGDQDCIDAIAENEVVIARMLERIDLIKNEVETRGLSWRELSGRLPEADDATVGVVPQSASPPAPTAAASTTNGTLTNGAGASTAAEGGVNGISSSATTQPAGQHSAWTDGTFQTGTIRAGGLRGVSDEELLRRLQDEIPEMADDDDEGGMHL